LAEQAQPQQSRGLIDQLSKEQLGLMYEALQQQYTNLQTQFNVAQANITEYQEQLDKLSKKVAQLQEPQQGKKASK